MVFKKWFGKINDHNKNQIIVDQKPVEENEIPITHRYKYEFEYRDKVERIKALGTYPDFPDVKNLLRILQFDVSGEIAIHTSLALASMENRAIIKEMIRIEFGRAPLQCAAGYPPKEGEEVFPLTRLLYPLAWMKEPKVMKELVDENPRLISFKGSGKAAYDLVEAVNLGTKAVAEKICWLEYLDEAGNKEIMDLAQEWYPLGVKDL